MNEHEWPYRIKSARRKRRLVKTDRDKQLIQLDKRRSVLWKQQRNLPWEALEHQEAALPSFSSPKNLQACRTSGKTALRRAGPRRICYSREMQPLSATPGRAWHGSAAVHTSGKTASHPEDLRRTCCTARQPLSHSASTFRNDSR